MSVPSMGDVPFLIALVCCCGFYGVRVVIHSQGCAQSD
nr:MAG TPA: hypothetical protein [Caudoviricetes sp.]